jgi:hypothetical protein
VDELTDLLLAVDPGKATGIALLQKDGDEVKVVWSRETEYYETADLMNKTLHDHGPTLHVACENFFITAETGKKSQAPWSLKLIGTLEYLCHAYGMEPPTLQPPSRAKDFVPNDRLRALGIWHVGGAGHAKDALRHGVLYYVEKLGWRPANLLA